MLSCDSVNSIDVALPTPVDDEYWSLPGSGDDNMPQQPEGKPSKIAGFLSLIRLSQILAFATRTLVSLLLLHSISPTQHIS